jgi:hypothetical protein
MAAAAQQHAPLLAPFLRLAANATLHTEAVSKQVDIVLATESTIGAFLLLASFVFQVCFAATHFDIGHIGRLQGYCTWCAGFAVIGHLCNAYGAWNNSFPFARDRASF